MECPLDSSSSSRPSVACYLLSKRRARVPQWFRCWFGAGRPHPLEFLATRIEWIGLAGIRAVPARPAAITGKMDRRSQPRCGLVTV
jgi:hypothetical protein